MIVTGRTKLALAMDSGTVQADHAGGSGSAVLTSGYTVASGDCADDGIAIAANSLSLNGGSVEDRVETAADLPHVPLGDQAGHGVDGIGSFVSEALEIVSTLVVGNTYHEGEDIELRVPAARTSRSRVRPDLH